MSIEQALVAVSTPCIYAPGTVLWCKIALGTSAEVAARGVGALASGTQPWDVCALIQVVAFLRDFVELVSSRALALKGSHGVDAFPPLAQTRDGLALIHILARPGAVVGYEAPPAGLGLGRAHLAGVTPGPAHRGAAEGLGAHDARQLTLAHLVAHGGEARPGPVVALALRSCEAIRAHAAVGSHAAAPIETAVLTHRLSAVVSHVAFLTKTVVLSTRSSIHAADVTVLD